jgi:hypothetical protein
MNFQGGDFPAEHVDRVRWLLQHNPVVALLGPQQIGTSTRR